jgi:hypothetical protein
MFNLWSPENPFQYEAEIKLFDGDKLSDDFNRTILECAILSDAENSFT